MSHDHGETTSGEASCQCHGHVHAALHADAQATGRPGDTQRLAWALGIIVAFAILEVVGGVLSGSLALLADAGHMATDALALGLALFARYLAKKPPSEAYPFGQQRAQIVVAFVNGIGLFFLISLLLVESVQRMMAPPEVGAGTMLGVAVIGLFANIVAFALLHGGDRHDLNMRGALLHVVGDMLGSVAAIVSAVIILRTNWLLIDPLVTLVVCGLLARAAWGLTRESAHVLLQGAPADLDVDHVRRHLVTTVKGVRAVDHLRVWMMTPSARHATLHVKTRETDDARAILVDIQRVLKDEFGIAHATVQLEPDNVVVRSTDTIVRDTDLVLAGSPDAP